jgi:hypothetical protein
MLRRPDEDAPDSEWGSFEFLDEEDDECLEAEGAASGLAGAGPAAPFAPPAASAALLPRTSWAAMDADYRPPAYVPLRLPLRDLLRPHPSREAQRQRGRLELPVIGVWLLLTCFSQTAWMWGALGAFMIGFSVFMRRPFELEKLEGQAAVYRAIGVAQVLGALSSIISFGPFVPLFGAYAVSVLLAWIFVEARQLYRMEKNGSGERYSVF